SSATITAGGSQAYTAEGFDSFGNDLGDVTSGTTFAVGPDGTCAGASCSATVAGSHIVTGANGAASATATLTVTAGALDHLTISPPTATIVAGGSQSYSAEGFDVYGNSTGDITSGTTFTIAGGSCSAMSCGSTVVGDHLVTGSDGSATDSATLTVT